MEIFRLNIARWREVEGLAIAKADWVKRQVFAEAYPSGQAVWKRCRHLDANAERL